MVSNLKKVVEKVFWPDTTDYWTSTNFSNYFDNSDVLQVSILGQGFDIFGIMINLMRP